MTEPEDELDAIGAVPIVRQFLQRVEDTRLTSRRLRDFELRIHPIDLDHAIALTVERARIVIAMDPNQAATKAATVQGAWLGPASFRTQPMFVNAADIARSMDRLVELAGESLDWTVTDRRKPGEQGRRDGSTELANPKCGKHGYDLLPDGKCWRCLEDGP